MSDATAPEEPIRMRLDDLAQALYQSLPFAQLSAEEHAQVPCLLRMMSESFVKLVELDRQSAQFLHSFVDCAVDVRKCRFASSQSYSETGKPKWLRSLYPPSATRLTIESPCLEMVARDDALAVFIQIEQTLLKVSREVARRFCSGLVYISSKAELVGKIWWGSDNVCKYDYVQAFSVPSPSPPGTPRQPAGAGIQASASEHYRRLLVCREVVKARRMALSATDVAWPDRVAALLKELPAWLEPHLKVVSGDVFLEVVKDVPGRSSLASDSVQLQNVVQYRRESAITLFDSAVLAGWFEDEVPAGVALPQKSNRPSSARLWRRAKTESESSPSHAPRPNGRRPDLNDSAVLVITALIGIAAIGGVVGGISWAWNNQPSLLGLFVLVVLGLAVFLANKWEKPEDERKGDALRQQGEQSSLVGK